jgi:hypothetical protein
MKNKIILFVLLLVGGLAAGCESSEQRASSVDRQFPPAPVTPLNAPDNNASGIHQ